MGTRMPILDPFDRSSGNGSGDQTDDWLDEKSIFDNQWGSDAATTFNINEAPASKQDRFDRLYEWHNGKGSRSRKHDINQSHIENDAETFMSVLELPEPQRETVRDILDELDLSSRNFGAGRSYEKIILAVCSLVADEALSQQPNPSVNDRLFLTDRFRSLMEVNKMSSSEHRRIRVAVREKSYYFND